MKCDRCQTIVSVTLTAFTDDPSFEKGHVQKEDRLCIGCVSFLSSMNGGDL